MPNVRLLSSVVAETSLIQFSFVVLKGPSNCSHAVDPKGDSSTGVISGDLQELFNKFPAPWGRFYATNPYILYRDSKNNEIFGQMLQPWGQNYTDKSLQIPTHCPTWGRWGLTMIGA